MDWLHFIWFYKLAVPFDAGMSGSVAGQVGRFNAGAIRDFDLLALFRSLN